MSQETLPDWEAKRTDQSRQVEAVLGKEFQQVDAYRYNAASIRVRVTDARLKGLSFAERDDLVEPVIKNLPEEIQADIMTLLTIYPGEVEDSFRARLLNLEFEDPSPSQL